MSAVSYSELTYERPMGVYKYPGWGVGIGWMLAAASVIFIPGVALYKVIVCWIKNEVSGIICFIV